MTHIRRHWPGSPHSCSPASQRCSCCSRWTHARGRRPCTETTSASARSPTTATYGSWRRSSRAIRPAPALGTSDTIAWRRALQSFWYTHIGANPQSQQDLPKLRAQAQAQLLDLTTSAKTAAERSSAANLLGVLVITTPISAGSQTAQIQVLKQSTEYFQQAIDLDPGDTAAKQNLELVLRVTRPGKGPIGKDAHAGFGFGRGHGATLIGNGY